MRTRLISCIAECKRSPTRWRRSRRRDRAEYPPVSTVTFGFRRGALAHLLDGFGMLIPPVEGRAILGALFNSSVFPDRAPDDHVTITCFVGGARNPQAVRENTNAFVARVLLDLRALIGVRGEPVYIKHVFWPRAILQYTVGDQAPKSAAEKTEVANGGCIWRGIADTACRSGIAWRTRRRSRRGWSSSWRGLGGRTATARSDIGDRRSSLSPNHDIR